MVSQPSVKIHVIKTIFDCKDWGKEKLISGLLLALGVGRNFTTSLHENLAVRFANNREITNENCHEM